MSSLLWYCIYMTVIRAIWRWNYGHQTGHQRARIDPVSGQFGCLWTDDKRCFECPVRDGLMSGDWADAGTDRLTDPVLLSDVVDNTSVWSGRLINNSSSLMLSRTDSTGVGLVLTKVWMSCCGVVLWYIDNPGPRLSWVSTVVFWSSACSHLSTLEHRSLSTPRKYLKIRNKKIWRLNSRIEMMLRYEGTI